jgi:hypothetical protein
MAPLDLEGEPPAAAEGWPAPANPAVGPELPRPPERRGEEAPPPPSSRPLRFPGASLGGGAAGEGGGVWRRLGLRVLHVARAGDEGQGSSGQPSNFDFAVRQDYISMPGRRNATTP